MSSKTETAPVLMAKPEEENQLSPNPAGFGFTKMLFVDSLPVSGELKTLYALKVKKDGEVIGYSYFVWDSQTGFAYAPFAGSVPNMKVADGGRSKTARTENAPKEAPEKVFYGLVVFHKEPMIKGLPLSEYIDKTGGVTHAELEAAIASVPHVSVTEGTGDDVGFVDAIKIDDNQPLDVVTPSKVVPSIKGADIPDGAVIKVLAVDENGNLVKATAPSGTVTVDGALSDESENPVQNKVITAELNKITSSLIELVDITWAQVQALVRDGLAPRAFAIGDQLLVTKGDSTIAFDIIGFDVDTPANPDFTHSMTLQAHNTVANIMFDQAELLHYVKDNVLPAGTYKFTLLHGQYGGGTANDGTYQFTTTKDIPVGGGFRINAWGYYESSYNVLTKKIITYDANGDALESDITITAYGGGTATDLGTYSTRSADLTAEELTYKNSIEKQGGGSNNYLNSGVRQWLNSDAAANAWWSKKTVFQRKNGSAGTAGFLNGLDPEFLAIVGLATKDVKEDEVWDKGGMKTFADKFFLLSNKEIRFTTYADEGVDYPYWTRLIPVATNDANDNRIKSNTYWWTRTCHRSVGNSQCLAAPTGACDSSLAVSTYGVVPACVII